MERILVIFFSHHVIIQEMDSTAENVRQHREANLLVFQPEDQERELRGAKYRGHQEGAGERSFKSAYAVLSSPPSCTCAKMT